MHEIAVGMQYLHSRGVLHGDLKASNVLVDDRFHAVLSDFGQSEIRNEISRLSGQPLSRKLVSHGHKFCSAKYIKLRWDPPLAFSRLAQLVCSTTSIYPDILSLVEAMTGTRLTTKTDVYAFAITCVEV